MHKICLGIRIIKLSIKILRRAILKFLNKIVLYLNNKDHFLSHIGTEIYIINKNISKK